MVLIDEFKQYIQTELYLSEETSRAYMYDVGEFLNFTEDKGFDIDLVDDFIGHLKTKRLLSTTIRRKYMSVRCFFRYLATVGKININSLKNLDSVRAESRSGHVICKSEIDRIISVIHDMSQTPRGGNVRRNVAIVLILYHSGLRVSELCGLDLEDINIKSRELLIHGKGCRDRVVPTTHSCLSAVQEYIEYDRQSSTKAVFVCQDGSRLKRRAVSDMITYYSRRAGVNHTTSHSLRKSCATDLMNNGMDIDLIQTILGHQQLSTTQRYLDVQLDTLRDIHSQCHPFGAKYVNATTE